MGRLNRGVSIAIAVAAMAMPAYCTIIQYGSGQSSVNQPVSFQAELTISGNTLTVVLKNTSSQSSTAPNDVLGSYYFDIFNGTTRPVLNYVSAVGDVYQTSMNPDALVTAGANLKATVAGDNTWQFKTMTATANPLMGFGLGTVGNNNLTPNGFNGNIVDGSDYSIVAGEITSANLRGLYVKGPITFTFTGVSGYTEADINALGWFGLGTMPDSLMRAAVPEPATMIAGALLLLPFGASAVRILRRKA